jgi:Cell wall-associated hydrolases (invasion-associated proteins)
MNHFAGKAVRIAAISAALSALLAANAFASDIGTGVGAISGSSVRMRSDASTSSSIVATLDKGTAVSILGQQDGWYRISYSGSTGYVSADFLTEDQDGAFTSCGRVNSDGVNIRSTPSVDGAVAASVDKGTVLTVTGFSGGWYSVSCTYGTTGYIRSDFVDLTASASESSSSSKVVSLAKQYLGTRYSYGGSSPSGFDCSGFTMYVYSQFGVSLPHTATGQWQSSTGTKIYSSSSLQTGDLVFFCDPSRSNGKACSHAGIYIGGGQFIHASSSNSGGVIISSLYEDYYSHYFVGGKHI